MTKLNFNSSARKWLSLEGLAWIVAICYGIFCLYVAFRRITYPYDLDFIEDNMLMQAIQVSLGKPVYIPPNANFVPQVYMPLYTFLGGWIFKVITPSYLPLRMISFTATILTAIMIFSISRRISGNSGVAFCAAILFLAGYRTTGGWYDLARVDALYIMLTLAGAALLIYGKENRFKLPIAGFILALAFLTKQNGLFFVLVVAVYLTFTTGWKVLDFLIPFVVISFLPILYLNQVSRGWFSTYVFKIAYLSPIDFHRVVTTLKDDLWGSMIGLTIPFIIAVVSLISYERGRKVLIEPWNWFIGAALFISIAGRASVGGNRNNLMPAYTFLCIAPALATRETRRWQDRWQVPSRSGLFILIIIQFVLTAWIPKNPIGFIPTSSMKSAGDQLIQRLASTQGPVLVMMHPYYALLAGKETAVDIQMLWHARLRGEEPLPDDFVSKIQNHYYSTIVSDESTFETQADIHQLITTYYLEATVLTPSQAPLTNTGVVVRPKIIYVPKQP
jgi:dolichyl-phosphate-mannose-protein mannosyltransferase